MRALPDHVWIKPTARGDEARTTDFVICEPGGSGAFKVLLRKRNPAFEPYELRRENDALRSQLREAYAALCRAGYSGFQNGVGQGR